MITARWIENSEGVETILHILDDGELSHFFEMNPAREVPDVWHVYECHRYAGVQKDVQGKFFAKVVYEGDKEGADAWMLAKEREVRDNREYNLKGVADTAQEIIDRIQGDDLISKGDFDQTARDVCAMLLALVEADDDSDDNDFISFVECYI